MHTGGNEFGGTHPASNPNATVSLDKIIEPFGITIRHVLETTSECVSYRMRKGERSLPRRRSSAFFGLGTAYLSTAQPDFDIISDEEEEEVGTSSSLEEHEVDSKAVGVPQALGERNVSRPQKSNAKEISDRHRNFGEKKDSLKRVTAPRGFKARLKDDTPSRTRSGVPNGDTILERNIKGRKHQYWGQKRGQSETR